MCWVSGHGEGWALYAERLMDDLGYLDDPGDKLGMLDAQALPRGPGRRRHRHAPAAGDPRRQPVRASIPARSGTASCGLEFLRQHCRMEDDLIRFEVNRYLGWPGQAPSYKVGERIWLAGPRRRPAAARRRTSTSRRSTAPRSTWARWASTRCAPRSPGSRDPADDRLVLASASPGAAGDAAQRRPRPAWWSSPGSTSPAWPTRTPPALAARLAEPARPRPCVARLRRRGEGPTAWCWAATRCSAFGGAVLGQARDADDARARWRAMRGRSGELHHRPLPASTWPPAAGGARRDHHRPLRRRHRRRDRGLRRQRASRCRSPARSRSTASVARSCAASRATRTTWSGVSLPALRELVRELGRTLDRPVEPARLRPSVHRRGLARCPTMRGIILAGGDRHPAASDHPRRQQAAAAGLRQADDLLPAVDADAGGDPRHPGHHHARTTRRRSSGCSATARQFGRRHRATPCSPSPTASRRRS